jgi:hypothetical protein
LFGARNVRVSKLIVVLPTHRFSYNPRANPEKGMNFVLINTLITVGLFIGMLLLLGIGRNMGARRRAIDPEGAQAGLGVVEGSIFGLMGLLLAFSFSGAASRFDSRKQLIVQEANDIGTAWLRLDLLPAAAQPALRDNFRRYLDSRLSVYRKLPDMDAARLELAKGTVLQGQIWTQALAASREGPPSAAVLLLPVLNQMIDITTTRTMGAFTHPPTVIFVMLASLTLASSLIAGYGMAGSRKRSWVHMLVFAGLMAATFYIIIDLEFPRFGLLREDAFDQVLVDLRHSMQ